MATKLAAKGTVLAYENPSSTWNTIPSVGDFDLPLVGTQDEIDVTSHDSTSEEIVLGIARTQSFTVPIKWLGTNTHHAYLRTAAAASTLLSFKVTCVDTKVCTFSGYVKGITLQNPVAGAFNANVEIKISGAVTYA